MTRAWDMVGTRVGTWLGGRDMPPIEGYVRPYLRDRVGTGFGTDRLGGARPGAPHRPAFAPHVSGTSEPLFASPGTEVRPG